MRDTTELLGTMPVSKAFVRLATPAVVAQLVNITYNLVDKMYIGHIAGAGSNALAGVGVTAPIIFGVSAFAALISMGGAPKASILMGEGKVQKAEQVMGSCTCLLGLLSLAITLALFVFAEPVCRVFGASDATVEHAVSFMRVYCLGTLFSQLALGLNAFVAAQGKTVISMAGVILGAVINILLDAVFVVGLSWGVAGAALATVIAQGISASAVVLYLGSNKAEMRLRVKNLRLDWALLGPCILLGTSPALMQLTENLVAISFNISLQTHGGDIAVASMSILTSVMQFVMLLLPGLVQGAQALLSYNLGANNIPRVKSTFRLLLASCVTGSFLIWVVCMIAPGTVADFFTDDAGLIAYTETSMRVYLATLLIFGVQAACQYTFVALDQAKKAIFLTIWRKIILLIPLIFLLPYAVPDPAMGVFLAEPIADTIAVCTTAPMFYWHYRKL